MKNLVVTLVFVLLFAGTLSAESDYPIIPKSVAWIYVFLQAPDNTDVGSGIEVGTMITPEKFLKDLKHYQALAKKDDKKLIITAVTHGGQWVQDEIKYKGERLRRALYYNPGISKVVSGVEFPLD